MPVFVQRPWNQSAGIIADGVGFQLSKNGTLLYVVNAKGARIALFPVKSVQAYWVDGEDSPLKDSLGQDASFSSSHQARAATDTHVASRSGSAIPPTHAPQG